jgi:glycosyltransferase involved in cell wall biosynthesis
MSRVLLVCPEPLAHGNPAGIGIRFLEIARVLAGDGHTITLLSPDEIPVASSSSVSALRMASLTPENLNRFSGESDMAIVQGHAANDFFAHARTIPTVIDLYDPFIIENLHYLTERGPETFSHDHATMIASLLKGDFFLCASSAQRLFYLGALLATGRLNPEVFEADPSLEQLIDIAPFGVAPPREVPSRNLERPRILFGGIYHWYDPIRAIDAVAIARNEIPGLTLTFTRHPNPDITPQGKAADAMRYAKEKSYEFVHFEPWVSYAERGAFFDRFSLAILTFGQSLETELAMRTRIYDYLWGALPIVTNPAPGTDELLQRYGAGVVVQGDADDLAVTIVSILKDHRRHQQLVGATRKFVEEHQWPSTLKPLREFCRSPRFDRSKEAFAVRLHTPEQRSSLFERLRRRVGGMS